MGYFAGCNGLVFSASETQHQPFVLFKQVGFRFQTVPNELFSSKSGGESLNIATFFLLYGTMGYFDHQSGDGIFRKRENRSFDPVCSLNPTKLDDSTH